MSYMVIFRTPEGKPGYQQADDPREAIETVERLRNENGVENVRIYRMEEVAFEYKVHYTVELVDPTSAPAGEAPAVEAPAPAPAAAPAPSAALSWDDDDRDDDEDLAPTEAPNAPFDQMAAVDHTEAPRWGDMPGIVTEPDEVVVDDTDDAVSGARRGLFGR